MITSVSGDLRADQFHVFDSAVGPRLLVIPHSRIFVIDPAFGDALRDRDPLAIKEVDALTATLEGEAPLDLVPSTTPQSISLNVSAACNLGCGYCYAGSGGFAGAQTSAMTWEVARGAVDRLMTLANPRVPITVGFLGGEPFLNRNLIRKVVEYCSEEAVRRGHTIRFAVTTNGTLLSRDDIALLRAHPFGVTVSIDGGAEVHDAQRPARSGRSSFAALRDAIAPLVSEPGMAKVGARATITRSDLRVGDRFDQIVALGFCEVGFSPVRRGEAKYVLRGEDWGTYLDSTINLAQREMKRALMNGPVQFTNLAIALKQLHRGFSMPYPCGAGGGYFSVAVDRTWYACHRTVGQREYALGDNDALDEDRRAAFLRTHHVHSQSACRSCWARYLCSGGCHQEASAREASSCGFIRGWLNFCLGAYAELTERQPAYFAAQN